MTAMPAWCTAHAPTLAAVLATCRDGGAPILIEATCNQVNHEGGYAGMTPADFRSLVHGIARAEGVDPGRITLGGDHLGPNPWRHMAAEQAMARARAMVAAYVAAGFTKIHLDASMPCGGEVLAEATMAARAADLAAVACAAGTPAFVIGTEVPVPGGEVAGAAGAGALAVTTTDAARRTVDLHRAAFAARGLGMDRVMALVVQPGVDFGNDHVVAFDPARAAGLTAPLPLEAHSTDYQTEDALRGLVKAGCVVLKVGPELTQAYARAVLSAPGSAGVRAALLAAMRARPADWQAHAAPDAEAMLLGLSDRVRYYWTDAGVQAALAAAPPPGDAIRAAVGAVVLRYRRATEKADAAQG